MFFTEVEITIFLISCLACSIAGVIKGTLGIGLPLFAIPVLATFFDLPTAIALMVFPVMISNFAQALERKEQILPTLKFWSLLIILIPSTIISAQFLSTINTKTGYVVIGLIVIIFSILLGKSHTQLFKLNKLNIQITAKNRRYLDPIVGLIAGILGGVSNLFGPILVMYLVSLKMDKNTFIGTIATLFLFASSTLYITMIINGQININNALNSAILSAPVLFGVYIGSKIRNRLNQRTFELILIFILILIGLNLIRKGFL